MISLDLFFFFLTIISLILVGIWRTRRVSSEEGYLFADRKTKLIALTATLIMTEFNSATLISFSQLGFDVGLWALSLPLVFLAGLIFYALTVARKWKQYDGFSVGKYFEARYSKSVGVLATNLLMLAMLGFSAVYVKSLTVIFAPFFPNFSPWLLSALLLFVVVIMVLRGGLISIVRTDLFSALLMVAFFSFLLFWMGRGEVSTDQIPIATGAQMMPPSFVASLIVLTMFTYILAPWYGQKIFAAESEKTAFWAVCLAAIGTFILYGVAIVATSMFKQQGHVLVNSESAFGEMIRLCLPNGARGLGFAILFATSATTLTGLWSAMSAMMIGAIYPNRKKVPHDRSMILTLGFALSSFFLANVFVDKIFAKMILANIPVAALSFSLLAGFYWKRASAISAHISIVVGIISGVFTYLYFGDAGGYIWYWTMYGIPATFASGVIGTLIWPHPQIGERYSYA